MSKFWRLSYIVTLLFASCTSPGYPGIDTPHYNGNTSTDRTIISYIDQRLAEEYYWLDEVKEKSHNFNRNVKWENYLDNSLRLLNTNLDDGYVNNKGQRTFYSYIREISSNTRADVTGFGIGLHYTIATIDQDNGRYGFVVEKTYPDSPAEEAGVLRGDVITMIAGSYITPDNYYNHFMSIENSSVSELKLKLRRQSDGEVYDVTLHKGTYPKTPVIHSEVIEYEETKIGYLVYTDFNAEYDNDMLNTIREMSAEGISEFILDLRCNKGGSINSAVKLCSAVLPNRYNGNLLYRIERNSKNSRMDRFSEFYVEDAGEILNLENITVICSGYSASASELVIMGLRGLDIPVTLIGSTTEGKNCGMDVTRRTLEGKILEFAPITFMCFNAKGVCDWGDGIIPDIDITQESNETGVSDKYYPMPRTAWGDYNHDIALAVAVAKITGKNISQSATRASANNPYVTPVQSIAKPAEGIRIYHQ